MRCRWRASRATIKLPCRRSARARAARAAAVPKELLVQRLPDERATIEAWLSAIKGQRVRILQPQRGARAEYMRLVQKNAEQNLKAFLAHQEVQETAQATRADRARRRARSARAAAPHRVLRHLEHPGNQSGRVDGRVRRRPAEEERLPQVQDPVRSRAERFCDDAGDAAPAAALSAARDRPHATRRSSASWPRKRSSTRSPTCC